ncbi:endonuclease-8 [Tamaricihabitans halophyticus]|uniref:DNA-(apurinic or apyrimidinic site) lyase n=1 Tax=Tamaricihabitans halophyticus TaxID=1262583 RepID=A0A4R2Q0E9_9PSEU|nr:DNA-formamidopyrimidine glycosylase family protein [Tamaricihabitans halophyticus]TCP41134.1 endonuclease-8 [Tamaricihabitans halophyticus]
MPEGDTVFRAAHQLDAALAGKELSRAELRHPRLATVELAGHGVLGARSAGKHLFIRFTGNLSLHNHLRMDGLWQVGAPSARWQRPAHQARAVLGTTDRLAIGFHLHELAMVRTDHEHRLLAGLGPDLLDPHWTDQWTDEIVGRLRAMPTAELSTALLDQRVMAGVGNLYATEVCFLLGRTPWTLLSELDDQQLARAVDLSRQLLSANAWRAEQSTTGELRRGRRTWVYERSRTGCFSCGGRVHRAKHGAERVSRVAFYCPRCQTGPVRDGQH